MQPSDPAGLVLALTWCLAFWLVLAVTVVQLT